MSVRAADWRGRIDHMVFGVAIIVSWTYFTRTSRLFPSPLEIFEAFLGQLRTGALLAAFESAIVAILIGYFLAVLVGIPLGVAMGVNRHVENIADPYVNGLYALPISAMVPAFIIWFGTGLQVRVIVVFFFSIFTIVINTLEGAKTVPVNLIEVANSFGADRRFIIRNVVIPHEVTYIATGLRLASGRAVKGLVVAELLVSVSGFGLLIHRASSALELSGVFSVVILLMLMGIVAVRLLKIVENRLIAWDTADV